MDEKQKITIDNLMADPENPRRIDEDSKKQLNKSIKDFANISEITFNIRTGQLVAGHQRLQELKAIYPNLSLKKTDKPDWLDIQDGEGKFTGFRARIVDWDEQKQKAGNIVANSPLVQGQWDVDKLQIVLDKYDLDFYADDYNFEALSYYVKNEDDLMKETRNSPRIREKPEDTGEKETIIITCDYDTMSEILPEIQKMQKDKYGDKITIKF